MTLRQWSLQGARAILTDVYDKTEAAVVEVDALVERRNSCTEGSESWTALEVELRSQISRWARAMDALGVQVRGVWQVDFDNGEGCYGWQWPEAGLHFFHAYDQRFEDRTPIQ